MISLETIKQEVNRRVQESNKIILGVLGDLIKSHNEYCGCEYCRILTLYVKKKIRFQKAKRDVFRYDTRRNSYNIYVNLADNIQHLSNQVKELKKEKDKIKSNYINQLSI